MYLNITSFYQCTGHGLSLRKWQVHIKITSKAQCWGVFRRVGISKIY
ncbi:18007_t:CDS:2 [Gigaspora rosea]|nr:18007_t:CDS:2 [Gigaspora rosea]